MCIRDRLWEILSSYSLPFLFEWLTSAIDHQKRPTLRPIGGRFLKGDISQELLSERQADRPIYGSSLGRNFFQRSAKRRCACHYYVKGATVKGFLDSFTELTSSGELERDWRQSSIEPNSRTPIKQSCRQFAKCFNSWSIKVDVHVCVCVCVCDIIQMSYSESCTVVTSVVLWKHTRLVQNAKNAR